MIPYQPVQFVKILILNIPRVRFVDKSIDNWLFFCWRPQGWSPRENQRFGMFSKYFLSTEFLFKAKWNLILWEIWNAQDCSFSILTFSLNKFGTEYSSAWYDQPDHKIGISRVNRQHYWLRDNCSDNCHFYCCPLEINGWTSMGRTICLITN